MKFMTIFVAIVVVLLGIFYFLREYNLMDYISKDFGTIIGFSYNFLDWAYFNFIMLTLILTTAIIVYYYMFRGINKQKFQLIGEKLIMISLIILTSWVLSSILLYWVINQFTIETWFA